MAYHKNHPSDTTSANMTEENDGIVPVLNGMAIPASVLPPHSSATSTSANQVATQDVARGVISGKTFSNLTSHVYTEKDRGDDGGHDKNRGEDKDRDRDIEKGDPNFGSESTMYNNDKAITMDNVDAATTAAAAAAVAPAAPMTFPDGGFGWFVVFGAFMIQFCCWGFNFSWGVYQQYYVESNTFPGATLSQISWSGGIGSASVFLTTPFQTLMVAKFGLRRVIMAGILVSGAGMISGSFAKTLWQLYLTQGLMFGLGAGMALFTSVAIPVQWFDKKRGLASGITVAGSGLGGATLAPLNRYLISRLGYQWALRIMGMTVIGMFVTFGYLTPIFLMPKFVTDLGMDPTVGATLVSVFAGVNAVSRIMTGFVADVFGPLNILILTTMLSGLACYMFWMSTKGLVMAVVFMVFYGLNAGGFNSLFPVVAADVIGLEVLAASVGLLYSGNFFGNLLGTPLASAIIAASGGTYIWAQAFAGIMPILGASMLLFIRFKDGKKIFIKM
ncbi:hypothetical protein EDD11_002525 [Mortierella claussenii]|nr:hypothetical protein EDD11_002525 [Mortierella claussenii]